ncbi:MAG: hypothetical protein KKI09_07595 [Spirochaetes bacterium]|nr:hypothetical protein [Spirochaetota bacterium]MBU0955276.1 hypothetical protein [Spirochaetota bacterium]
MKTTKVIMLALVAIMAISMLASCATSYKTTNGQLSYGNINGASAGEFEATGNVRYLIHPSIVSLTADNEQLDVVIDPVLADMGAKGIKNVEIIGGFDVIGFAIRYFTGGLLGWDYVMIKGEAVK